MARAGTPYDLLRTELERDPGRPLVTYYDDATKERIELSVATFENWVAKTAGLLRDGLSAGPGDRVGVLLPPHWQALAWAAACWAVGACVVVGPSDGADDLDVAVVGPDTLTEGSAPDVVALSLRPLGARFTDTLPEGVLDYALEAPSYPDRLVPYVPPDLDLPGVSAEAATFTLAELVERARVRADNLRLPAGARVLVATHDLMTALGDTLLVPLVVGGSAVLVRNEDLDERERRIGSERVVAVLS